MQETEHSRFCPPQSLRIVEHFCLQQEALGIGEKVLCRGQGIVALDRAFRSRIAHGGFQIPHVPAHDFRGFPSDALILRAQFGSQRDIGTSAHLPAFRLLGGLHFIHAVAKPADPLQWRRLRRKNPVQIRLLLLPARFHRRDGQIRLRRKKVIKTPLLHLRLPANVIDAHGVITVLPNQPPCHSQQLRSCFTLRLHKSKVVDRLVNARGKFSRRDRIPITSDKLRDSRRF